MNSVFSSRWPMSRLPFACKDTTRTPRNPNFSALDIAPAFFESSKTDSNWLIFSNFRAPFECNKNVYCDIGFLLVHPVKAMQIQGSSHHTCILSIQQRAMKHEFRQTMCCLV